MEKNKKLIKKEGEASDKELENVSGGTEITGNESIKINNNNFDTSIKFNNVDTSIKINNNNVDMGIKHSNNFNNRGSFLFLSVARQKYIGLSFA